MSIRSVRAGLAVLGLLMLTLPIAPLAAGAAATGTNLTFTATIDGLSLAAAGANSPVPLHPTDGTIVQIEVTNNGSSPIEVRAVRLDARVLGLAFFSYTTRVDLTLDPGASGSRTFALDLTDLDGQATGLLPGELSLLAPDRTVLASQHGAVDVRGKLKSVYGVFGIAVASITALLFLSLVIRLFRRTLPDSRWARALRFAVPGLGLGLVATFTLGVLRIAVPSLTTSFGLLAGGLVVGFVLGYLTPSPGDEADRDELDERDIVSDAQPAAPPTEKPPRRRTTAVPAAETAPPPTAPSEPVDDPRQTRVVSAPPPPPPA